MSLSVATKGAIKRVPWLYALCLKLYRFRPRGGVGVTARMVRDKIKAYVYARPYLHVYIRHGKNICKGRIRDIGPLFKQLNNDIVNRRTTRAHKRAIGKLYREAILCCIHHGVDKWWVPLSSAQPGSINELEVFLRDYVLRQAGDYTAYIRLSDALTKISGSSLGNGFFRDMAQHYSDVMDDIDAGHLTKDLALDANRRPFVIGVCMWGDHYLNMFLDYCLASLMTPGNMEALCAERQPVLFIHTNQDGIEKISQAKVAHTLQEMGVLIQYRLLDEALLVQMREDLNYKYWHLGMVQSLDMYFAKALDADYHLLMPDTIYSNNHFAGMLRAISRGHQSINRLYFSTHMETLLPEVDMFRHEESISIPALDLAVMSVRHIHPALKFLFLTNKDIQTQLPHTHMLIWVGKDSLHTVSPHQGILYLDREAFRRIGRRFFMTLDSELDKIVPEDFDVYSPKAEDDMGIIEVSPADLRPASPSYSSMQEFADRFWSCSPSKAYWRFFAEDGIDPFDWEAVSGLDVEYMSDEAIQEAKQVLRSAVLERYPTITKRQKQVALEVLEALKNEPEARKMQSLIDKSIKYVEHQRLSDIDA